MQTLIALCPDGELTITEEARREIIEDYELSFRSLPDQSDDEENQLKSGLTVSGHSLQVITSTLEQIDPELPEQADIILPP